MSARSLPATIALLAVTVPLAAAPTPTPVTGTAITDIHLVRPTNSPTPLTARIVSDRSVLVRRIDVVASGLAFGRDTSGPVSIDMKWLVPFDSSVTLPDGTGTAITAGRCSVPVHAFVYGGGNTAATVVARLTLEGEAFDSAPETSVPGTLFLWKIPARLKIGTHTVKLELDPDHKVPDANRANNVGSVTYTLNRCGSPVYMIPLPPKK